MSKERKHRFPIRNAIARAGWNTSVYYSYHVEEGGNSHACYPASDYATSYVEVWLDGNEIREGKHAKYEMCIGSWPTQIIVSLYQMPVTICSMRQTIRYFYWYSIVLFFLTYQTLAAGFTAVSVSWLTATVANTTAMNSERRARTDIDVYDRLMNVSMRFSFFLPSGL